ncbi:uncharacterized protein LOC106162167 isoform X1 [Lingula anatina]|uniref:Uncharacterized protein LOC106162167 isoform X1 n=2 Tax=Lingula anatina TaxID=7574 RepID=A0A1S3IBK8_LINAN|nr:uncharacterized protein LOC106162167 isoform X1 [Lingula anatina]|eukprot:XP_013394799.1 uncharacterized protein LOC106162167 isoform X1 [Lingula anatina]
MTRQLYRKRKRKHPAMESVSWYKRQDFWAWFAGIVFIAALIGAMFGFGAMRGWDAQSGYTHNTSATSRDRFWPEPYVPEPGVKGRYGVGADSRWYYWKLPPDQVTAFTRLFMWLSYVGHQLLMWAGILYSQLAKAAETPNEKYSTKLGKHNYILLGLNVFFHLLHLLQTHITYDALAQDVSIASSQSSVIMMLVLIVLLEYKERGMIFGWPSVHDNGSKSRKVRFSYGPINLFRKYHGYAFAWAVIYTFWYHPMENTWGHALGFAHTWLVMLQGSLVYTNMHLNRYWRLLLEIWVTWHGGVVAYQTGGPDMLGTKLWPMFVFGFALVLVLTQIFSLPFWRRIPWWTRVFPLVVYLAITIWCYSWIPDAQGRTWVRMQEIIRIPAVYYLYALMAFGLLYLILYIDRRCNNSRGSYDIKKKPSIAAQVMFIMGSVFVYAVMVTLSALLQILDVQIDLIALMILLVGVFIIGVCISILFLKQIMLRQSAVGPTEEKHSDSEEYVSTSKLNVKQTTTYSTYDQTKEKDQDAVTTKTERF